MDRSQRGMIILELLQPGTSSDLRQRERFDHRLRCAAYDANISPSRWIKLSTRSCDSFGHLQRMLKHGSGSSKTALWDDMPLTGEEDRRFLHQASRQRIERFPAMHREAIVPQQGVADLPVVAIDELGPGREVVDLLE